MKTILVIIAFTSTGAFEKVHVVTTETMDRCMAVRAVLEDQAKDVKAVCVQYDAHAKLTLIRS